MNYKVISIVLALMLVTTVTSAFAEEKISKATQKICQTHYKKYKINEQFFIEKFSEKRYFDSCMKLYKDKKWYFKGKSTIDKMYK